MIETCIGDGGDSVRAVADATFGGSKFMCRDELPCQYPQTVVADTWPSSEFERFSHAVEAVRDEIGERAAELVAAVVIGRRLERFRAA